MTFLYLNGNKTELASESVFNRAKPIALHIGYVCFICNSVSPTSSSGIIRIDLTSFEGNGLCKSVTSTILSNILYSYN